MSGRIKPLGKRLLVKRSQAATTKGGIFLPESSQEKPKQGEVIEAGPGEYNEMGELSAMEVKVGDTILFGSYAGTPVQSDSKDDLLILSEDEVLAIVE